MNGGVSDIPDARYYTSEVRPETGELEVLQKGAPTN